MNKFHIRITKKKYNNNATQSHNKKFGMEKLSITSEQSYDRTIQRRMW